MNKKSKNFNKKKKGSYIPKDKDFDPAIEKNMGNHPSWYKTNEQLAKDTASIPFGYQLGGRKNHGPYGDKFNDYSIAGLMRINYMPVYGHLDNITAPFNIASRNIYTNLKSVNSRAKSYDAPDIAIYLGAVDNLLAFHEFMKRIYGLMNTASITNRYYAEAAVRAAGADYDSILSNINDFRAYINRYALRVSTLPIPAEMSVFARHAWLNAHVWYDSSLPTKAQSYVTTPIGFWKYALDSDGAGCLKFQKLSDYGSGQSGKIELTFEEIMNLGEVLLSAVLYGAGDEDFNIMGGDILYAYGENRVYRASTIDEGYAVIPQYDAWVCDQINNSRMFGEPTEVDSFIIRQDADKKYLEHVLQIALPNTANLEDVSIRNLEYPWNNAVMDQYINIFDGDTSSDHIMVATRLMNIPVAVEESGNRLFQFLAVGTELCTNFTMYYYATLSGNASDWQLFRSPLYRSTNIMWAPKAGLNFTNSQLNDMNASNFGVIDMLAQCSSFDRRPLTYVAKVAVTVNDDDSGLDAVSTEYLPHAIIDINNYSIISYSTLKQMNDTILLAMFGIDEFGKQISLGK